MSGVSDKPISTCSSVEKHEIEWFREDLLEWFQINRRNFPWRSESTTLYEHVIAEVLLQRTKAETLVPFFQDFINRFGDWSELAALSVDELERYLGPIGLSKQRAPRLLALSKYLAARNGEVPSSTDELLALPAIGQYVAFAIQAYRGQARLPLLDASMARVVERVFGPRHLADIRFDPYLQELAQRLVDCDQSIEMSWAMLDLAALVCRPRRPQCDECPLGDACKYRQSQNATSKEST